MAGNGKSRRGFASMDPARQREIASKGGRAAHAKGTAHEWSSDEARVAGRKGGEVVSRDRAHMAAIGREGGEARGANARAARQQRFGDADHGDVMRDDRGADVRGGMADRELSRSVSREYASDRDGRGSERDGRGSERGAERSVDGGGLGAGRGARGAEESRL